MQQALAVTTLRTAPTTISKGNALNTFSMRAAHRRRVSSLIPWMLLAAAGTATNAQTADESSIDSSPAADVTVYGARPTDAGPLPGLLINRDQIPANLQSAGKKQIRDSNALNAGDFMNSQLQGVSTNDYSGNPFQMDVNYRGFTASPQIGTPEGLSVFFDGIRVNEPFGDVVNWDLLPLNALERFDLFPGSNPLFGLNTLGGAISLRTKSGFTSPGVEVSALGGAWGRKQVQATAGAHNDSFGGLVALQYFAEDGWRDDSPSKVRQVFVRGDWRGSKGVLTASALLANNDLIGNGLIPDDLYRARRQSVYTSPDRTKNDLQQFALSGALDATQSLNITTLLYRRRSDRDGVNGDSYEGFDDFGAETNVQRNGLHKRYPDLPWCQLANLSGSGRADEGNPILNGPDGVNCSSGDYTSLIPRNGASHGVGFDPTRPAPAAGIGPGVVDGTPIGLLSKTALDQVTDGAGVQANWNLRKHRFMVGVSTDRSRAGYELRQRLGLIDADHRVYEDPDHIDAFYEAAQEDIVGNEFDGTERTNSVYFNETWSPVGNVHLTLAARYNDTDVKSNLLTRAAEGSSRLDQIHSRNVVPFVYAICTSTDPATCAAEPAPVPFDFNGNASNKTQTQDNFDYTSFNPQIGINWLPIPTLNLFGNVSRGARVPSVVELGCAFDSTLVPVFAGPEDDPVKVGMRARSLVGPTCNLPTTLSGDPFLPQIRSTSGEVGARGSVLKSWRWNISAYRTELKDDIYFVGVADGRSYFDTIGKTRRQGLELGFAGEVGPLELQAGYSYVDATFRSTFYTVSPHNSSADFDQNSIPADELNPGQTTLPSATAHANRGFGTYHMIRIDPGTRLPGIPAHNFNASLTWHATQSWQLGLTVIAHSLSYMRGNENNLHQPGGTDQEIGQYICDNGVCSQIPARNARPFTLGGTTPGFAIVNFNTSFAIAKGLLLFGQVNNIFDKDYINGGRLGITPFSTAVNGAIGPSGWNYNSSEWQNTSFLAPGAPRGVFIGVRYLRDAK